MGTDSANKKIMLADILKIDQPAEYKAHFAVYNQEAQPLDVFVRDRGEWQTWNEYKGIRNDFNRRFIFSLTRFYSENDTWLFSGIYEVLGSMKDRYKIRLTDQAQAFIGRLKIFYKLSGRAIRLKFELYYPEMEVSEILKEVYTGQLFGGYETIDLSFAQIAAIIKNEKQDWKGALQNIKGVYLITDSSNGKRYVGSAYGAYGIWSRWKCYVETGHGWNDALTKLIKEKGFGYAMKYFKFTLLEYRPMRIADQIVIERESFWKEALQTRGDYGYNKN